MNEPLIFNDLDMSEYLGHPAIGSSDLRLIFQSPADFKSYQLGPRSDSKSTILGTAMHMALLEPAKFVERYALEPQDWRPHNKGDGYKLWNEFKALNKGKVILDWEAAQIVSSRIEAAHMSAVLQEIRRELISVETSVFCNEPGCGMLKARTDMVTGSLAEKRLTLWDVKTTSGEVDDPSLASTIYKYGYHFQAAQHVKLFQKVYKDFAFSYGWIFISTDTPAIHIVAKKASDKILAAGRHDHDEALRILRYCTEKNEWPGLNSETSIQEIDLPTYAWSNYAGIYTEAVMREILL